MFIKKRLVFCLASMALSWAAPQVVYAQQHACEGLVAVSYASAELTAQQQSRRYKLNEEFLQDLAQNASITIALESAQELKALAEVHSGRVDLIIGVYADPAQDAQLDYLSPAYVQKNYRLWVRTGEHRSVTQWPELSGLRGVRLLESKHSIDFDLQAQLLNWPLRTVDSLGSAVSEVLEGRADYVVAEQQVVQQYLAEHDLERRFEFIDPPVEVRKFFLAMSKDSVCNTPELRKSLANALAKLVETQ